MSGGRSSKGRLIARCIVPPEALAAVEDHALFAKPVHLGLLGFEEPPGLQCRLLAFVDSTPPSHPTWTRKTKKTRKNRGVRPCPAPTFESAGDGGPSMAMGEPEGTVPILLGHIVRMSKDRKHPDDLAGEATDVLATILTGSVSEVVDRVLEDLLGEGKEGEEGKEG